MCFSMDWLLHILIWAVIIGAIVKVVQLLIPYAMRWMGAEVGEGVNLLVSVFRIIFTAIIVIVVLIIAFQLISCLLSYAGGGGGLLPRR